MRFDGSDESVAAVTEWLRRTVAPTLRIELDTLGYAEFRFHDDRISTPVNRGEIIVRLNGSKAAGRSPMFQFVNGWVHENPDFFHTLRLARLDTPPEVTVDPDADWVKLYHERQSQPHHHRHEQPTSNEQTPRSQSATSSPIVVNQDIITNLMPRYIRGDFDGSRGYVYPYTVDVSDVPTVMWFDDEDCKEREVRDGYYPSAHSFEFSPLWYAVINEYPEFKTWSVEHGGLRFEDFGHGTPPATHERYEEIIAEAHNTFIALVGMGEISDFVISAHSDDTVDSDRGNDNGDPEQERVEDQNDDDFVEYAKAVARVQAKLGNLTQRDRDVVSAVLGISL